VIDKLWWYDYDKPCFYIFKGAGKEHKKNMRKRRRNRKISPVLGPALIWPMERGSRSWGALPLQ